MLLRRASLSFAVAALAMPPIFGWWLIRRDSETMAARGFICGNPLIGDALIAVMLAGLLSFVALVSGSLAFRRLPAPRPRVRKLELLVVSLPMLAAVGLFASVLLVF